MAHCLYVKEVINFSFYPTSMQSCVLKNGFISRYQMQHLVFQVHLINNHSVHIFTQIYRYNEPIH